MVIPRDVLWEQLDRLTELRLAAVRDRDEGILKALDRGERVIMDVLSTSGNETELVWTQIERFASELVALSKQVRDAGDLSLLLDYLIFCHDLLNRLEGRPAVSLGLLTATANADRPIRSKAPRDINLNGETLRVLKTALSGNYSQMTHICLVLWPQEYDELDRKKKGMLVQRFRNAKRRAFQVLPRVLGNPALEASLPGPQREFYAWLRQQFGDTPFERVKRQLKQIGHPKTSEPKRGNNFVLGASKLQVMKSVLLEGHQTDINACQSLWPEEFAVKGPDVLSSRFSQDKKRGLAVMKRVLAAPDRNALGLPRREAQFYDEVVTRFGPEDTFNKVREHANRHSPRRKVPGGNGSEEPLSPQAPQHPS